MINFKNFIKESPFTTARKIINPNSKVGKGGVNRSFGTILGRSTIIRIFTDIKGVPRGFLQWGTKEIRLDDLKIRIEPDQLLKMKKVDIIELVQQAIDDKLI